MKKLYPILISLLILTSLSESKAQVYTTGAGEMIFSWSNVTEFGTTRDTRMRWSPVFNFGVYAHYDFGRAFGLYSGLMIKNIGFIYQTELDTKVIQRTYNLGIPVVFKIGNLDKFFLYAGYQLEIPFHYKNKSWDSSDRSGAKTKFTQFFGDATPSIYNTFLAGIQFYRGINIKFHWYPENFINPDYIRNGVQINEGLEVEVFSFSIVANMFRGTQFYYDED